MRSKTFVCSPGSPGKLATIRDEIPATTTTRTRHGHPREFDLLNKQTFASRHTDHLCRAYRVRERVREREREEREGERIYFPDSRVHARKQLTPPGGKSDYKRMHGPASRLPPLLQPSLLKWREQTEVPCLSIKTDPLAGSVAWSIFHNYSSAWRLPHPYLSVYSRSRSPRRLNVICRTKFDFDESMGKIGNERHARPSGWILWILWI